MSAHTTKINWSFILDKIEEEKCILVLGPEAYHHDQTRSLQAMLLDQLDIPNNPNIHKYYPDDEFFLFDDAGGQTITCHQIKQFYDSQPPPALLEKIVQIPFHVILTVTADRLLLKSFDDFQLSYQADHYRRRPNPQIMSTPNRRRPLIYNLFGSIAEEESMVLTYDDLFDYFSSVFAKKSMPDKLKMELNGAKNFIFLGVPFDRWYMQLLLRLLQINRQQFAFKRYAANQSLTDEMQTFCVEQFKIDFVNKRIQEFVDQLYQQSKERGILREVDGSSGKLMDRIREMVAEDQLEEAILELKEMMEKQNHELLNDVLAISSLFRRFKRKVRAGSLSPGQENTRFSQITESLLDLIDEIESLENERNSTD